MRLIPLFRRSKCLGGESGQALIETAISLSLLVVMLIGVVEIANIAYAAVQVTNAAKAAVQYGDRTIGAAGDTTGMQNAAANEAPYLPNLSTNVSTSCVCADGVSCSISSTLCAGSVAVNTLNVTTSTNFTPFINLPGLPTSITLQGYAAQQVLSDGF